MNGRMRILWTVAALGLIPVLAEARITRIEITRVESPAFEGRSFGDVGQYEKVVGRAFGDVDPAHPLNAGIVNIDKAPKNAAGRVEYSVDFYVLMPVDLGRGNGRIFYNVVNRGNKQALGSPNFNDAPGANQNDPRTAADAGNGFLMRQGYILLWSAWQGDILPGNNRVIANFPIATNPDGSPITKVITAEFIEGPAFTVPIGETNTRPYLPVEASMAAATLHRRAGPHAPREVIPRDQWSFARCPDGVTMTPSLTNLCLPAGFSQDFIYELVYEARDPIVMGLGPAAIRDVISFLRREAADDFGTPNPLNTSPAGPTIVHALMWGSSQAGRFVRDFLWQGFNEDENGRRVFEGVIPHKAGSRKTWTNFAFAFPGRFSQAVENHYASGDQFPFAYRTLTDPISGRTDGILARCSASRTCPKVMHTDTSTEVWAARGSLVMTDPLGVADLPIPENVRLYLFASTQHGPAGTPARGICQQLSNPLPFSPDLRATLVAFDKWVSTGQRPPPTRYPRVADGTAVPSMPQAVQGFPAIPGVRYNGQLNDLSVNDEDAEPPEHVPGTEYTVLVPTVDDDGNDLGGVRSVTLQAPLGTYTGWNLRQAGFMEDQGCGLTGSFIPFARTQAERLAAGDPRLSLEERYETQAGYVLAVERATHRLLRKGYLLEEDAERLIQEAKARDLGLPPGRPKDRAGHGGASAAED